ncbi:MAG: hypothetical protein LBB89_13185 [Treponema sp.]|nr:hypothetical protein [Treponema sp.]
MEESQIVKLIKFKFLPFMLLAVGFISCASSQASVSKAPSLDEVIQQAAGRIEERLDNGTKVALINVQSPTAQFSEYVLNYLESILVNNGKLIVVDRANLDKIRQEQGFQLSGEVSDESAKAIGKMLGAGAIVTGTLINIGDSYRLTLKAINVETATVAVSYPADIAKNERVRVLLASQNTTAPSNRQTPVSASSSSRTTASQTPATAYKIGDTGPAGGIIFYDKGNTRNGWRFLEAAPANTEKAALSYSTFQVSGVSRKVGEGKENTKKFMEIFEQKGGGINTAPWLCNDLNINGFNDWYLPNNDELLYMYNNLYSKGLGNFKSLNYWSSYGNSQGTNYIDFSNGSEHGTINYDYYKYQVRAVRQF